MTIRHEGHHLDPLYQWVPDDKRPVSGWLLVLAICVGFPLAMLLMPLWPFADRIIAAAERRGFRF
jgi:hypothetical protein